MYRTQSWSLICGALPDDYNRTKVRPRTIPSLGQYISTLHHEHVTSDYHRTKPSHRIKGYRTNAEPLLHRFYCLRVDPNDEKNIANPDKMTKCHDSPKF